MTTENTSNDLGALIQSEEQIAKSLEALEHSVDAINNTIAAATKTEDTIAAVTRNYQHLEIMIAKDYIKPTKANLTKINAAITAAKEFVA